MSERQQKLVKLLIVKTNASELDWQLTSDSNTILTNLSGGRIVLSFQERNDQPFIYIRVYGNDGTMVDEFNDEDLTGNSGEPWYPKLTSLLNAGRRHANGADKILDELIQELQSDIPF